MTRGPAIGGPAIGGPARPTLPPLLRGEGLRAGIDPFAKAVSAAALGADPGLVPWSEDAAAFRVAVLLAPQMALERAMGAAFAVLLGFSDSLGALAPPEVAVHFAWPDRIKVNGAFCGRLRAAASTADPAAEPDWLAFALDVPLMPQSDAPGETPDRTALWEEGCAELTPPLMIESWSRHFLVWLHRFEEDGLAPLHAEWRAKCDTLGEEVREPARGLFLGLDELGGMILREGAATRVIPLTAMLETTA